MASIWNVPEVLREFSRSMLGEREKLADDLKKQCYVRRTSEACHLSARIGEIQGYGGNILLVGDPGSGKSSFINWFLNDSPFSESVKPRQYTVDLKATGALISEDSFQFSIRVKFTDAAVKYLRTEFDDPCHEIKTRNDIHSAEEAMISYSQATERLIEAHHSKAEFQNLYLFIDDIDYVEPKYFSILMSHLKPFLMARCCCVVLAARRPAYNAIMADDDYMISHFFDRLSVLEISHLETAELVAARVKAAFGASATLLSECADFLINTTASLYSSVMALVLSDSSGRLEGEGTLEDPLIVDQFPLTERQLSYVQHICNGNIRTMTRLCQAIVEYISENHRFLERDSSGRCVIGRERLLSEFADEKYGDLRIQNLNKRKGVDGTSLYVVILEVIHDFKDIDETVLRRIKELGFTVAEVDDAIKELYSMGMMEERFAVDRRALGERRSLDRKYVLTPRGRYYIEYMIHWDQYIKAYGSSKHHAVAGDARSSEFLRRAVLQFLASIGIAWSTSRTAQGDSTTYRVGKANLLDAFLRQGRELLVWANRSDRVKPMVISLKHFEQLLTDLAVVRAHGLDDASKFLVDNTRVRSACNTNDVRWEIQIPFRMDEITQFVAEHVREPRRASTDQQVTT